MRQLLHLWPGLLETQTCHRLLRRKTKTTRLHCDMQPTLLDRQGHSPATNSPGCRRGNRWLLPPCRASNGARSLPACCPPPARGKQPTRPRVQGRCEGVGGCHMPSQTFGQRTCGSFSPYSSGAALYQVTPSIRPLTCVPSSCGSRRSPAVVSMATKATEGRRTRGPASPSGGTRGRTTYSAPLHHRAACARTTVKGRA